MTDPDKPAWEYMLGQEIQEVSNVHGHDAMLTATLVLLVVVRDMRVSNVKYSGIGDGDAISIASDVFKNKIDSLGRRPRVDDPVLGKALLANLLVDDDTILLEPSGKQRHKLSTELGTHGTHGEKEVTTFTALDMMPHTTLIHSASRHNAVNVRMVEQVRSPRMENGSHTSKQSLCSSEGVDGAPCCLEHTVVEDGLVSHSNRMQTRGHSEYDMEVLGRDNLFPSEVNPLLTLLILTLGAMTIPAAVVADMDIPTLGAYLHMPAQCTGTALCHVTECPFYSSYDVMTSKEFFSVFSDNLTEVVGSPHFFLGGKMVSIKRTCFIGSMSAT